MNAPRMLLAVVALAVAAYYTADAVVLAFYRQGLQLAERGPIWYSPNYLALTGLAAAGIVILMSLPYFSASASGTVSRADAAKLLGVLVLATAAFYLARSTAQSLFNLGYARVTALPGTMDDMAIGDYMQHRVLAAPGLVLLLSLPYFRVRRGREGVPRAPIQPQ